MRDVLAILSDLGECAASGDTGPIRALMDEMEVGILDQPQLSLSGLSAVKQLLENDAFLKLQDSWRLVRFINNNWEALSANQRQAVRGALVGAFDKFADWMGAFVIGEILGDRYGDQDAFESLRSLAQSARMPARSLVTHGLETLAREGRGDVIRAAASEELRVLSTSDLDDVRSEALAALGRLERRSDSPKP